MLLADSASSARRRLADNPALIGAGAALAGFAALQLIAYAIAGVFEYPLDDVYIHLAMAEGIARGIYGVNPGEVASASSSAIWPLLLTPFPGTVFQRLLPLLLNIAAVAAEGALWGRILVEGGVEGRRRLWLAAAGPLALNMQGVAFTGMENTLHAALSLIVLIGLWRFLTRGKLAAWFAAALILSPLVRLEGLALSMGSVALIALAGRRRPALALAAAILLPVAGFSAYLTSLGLDPLPGSVVAKAVLIAPNLNGYERAVFTLITNLGKPQGAALGILSLTGLGLALLRAGPARQFLAMVSAAGFAQLIFGQIGWMHRYEHYIVVAILAAMILTMTGSRPEAPRLPDRLTGFAVTAALCLGVPLYQTGVLTEYVWNPSAIHLQQAQMARFVRETLKEPVAVNDLGWVSWSNENYVLDLWGLGNYAALHLRIKGAEPGWAEPLLNTAGVHYAVIYRGWLGSALGPEWKGVAELRMYRDIGRLGGWIVTFYADDPVRRANLVRKLREFAPTLPEGATLAILNGTAD